MPLEDEALLRGEGRFMDDLEPVPHAWHAAIVRSQLAHARVSVDATAARQMEGVAGVVTGEDVARLSRPFPAAIDSPVPHYAAAVGTARYVGEPLAVVVARDRYLAEDAAELVAVEYEPLDPVVDPVAAEPIHERRFHYGDVDDAGGKRDEIGASARFVGHDDLLAVGPRDRRDLAVGVVCIDGGARREAEIRRDALRALLPGIAEVASAGFIGITCREIIRWHQNWSAI